MSNNSNSLADLTSREKIAQLFVMGFRGSDLSAGSEVLSMIQEWKPGGVILFDKDMVHEKPVHNIVSPQQLQSLTRQLQEASSLPLLIAVDQEGGQIQRLKPEYGFPETRSHASLGKVDDPEGSFKEGANIGKMLAEAGINLNLAPVVDLAKEDGSSIIAKRERSFGKDPELVTRNARAYIQGISEYQVLSCCKHFPGHGSAKGDSHAGFVDVSESWDRSELLPYEHLIADGLCPMVMTAHIFNQHLDEELPATLSPKVIDGLLRDELGYEGVVISDDLQMKAISDHYSLKETLELGLKAGLDLFCFGNNLLKEPVKLSDAVQAIEALVEEGHISMERIDRSVARILELKSLLEG